MSQKKRLPKPTEQVTQINSIQDIMSPTFPKHIFNYFNKGEQLRTEWGSSLLMKTAGFQPTTVYSTGDKVSGIVILTPDGHVAFYGWESPLDGGGMVSVIRQIKGLHTFTMDDGKPPYNGVLVGSEYYGPDQQGPIIKKWRITSTIR